MPDAVERPGPPPKEPSSCAAISWRRNEQMTVRSMPQDLRLATTLAHNNNHKQSPLPHCRPLQAPHPRPALRAEEPGCSSLGNVTGPAMAALFCHYCLGAVSSESILHATLWPEISYRLKLDKVTRSSRPPSAGGALSTGFL
jgi:hypothetical protein